MQKKAAQKLLCCHCHKLLFVAVGVIFPAKRDLAIGEANDPVIGDGHTMGVAGQVMKNMPRAAERRFGVNDPVVAEERTKKGTEYPFLRKWLKVSWKC